jgi:signal transduction histidine kinase
MTDFIRAGSQRLRWPISVRVPVVVAVLMMVISVAISNRVLTRLEETQERNLRDLASAYLDGLSASLMPSVLREDVWEVFDILDRSRERYKNLNVQYVFVTNADGLVIAASDPSRFPSQVRVDPTTAALFENSQEVSIDEDQMSARMVRAVVYQDREIGRIFANADVGELMRERGSVLRELILSNVLLTLFLILVGYFAVRRMLKPAQLLSSYMARSSSGRMEPIPEQTLLQQGREYRELFTRYNIMSQAVNERETLAAELAEEEKLASLGRLASGMAHEINNPLGGMFNALDSLKRYGDQQIVRSTSVRLLEQGLSGIRDLVRSTLTTYRMDQRPRDLTPTDLDDLRLLVKPEAKRKQLQLRWDVRLEEPAHVPAVAVRDAVLNLLLNACHACRQGGTVSLRARVEEDDLVADISDEGQGLPSQMREYIERKGAGSAPLDRRSGLGLWIVKRLCDEIGATLEVVRSDQSGTVLRLRVGPTRTELPNVA